jgi:DNA (cytosine-5)-methyltransferase 1
MIRVFEAFAGYGGASFGLKRCGIEHSVIGFSEFDKFASEIYLTNHPKIKNYGDITKIDPNDLPDFDLFTGGFPCQPFSTVGLGLGESDTRGTLFHEIIRICSVKQPKHILLENVKGLLSKTHKKTLEKILLELKNIGYDIRYELLNTKDYGIPQNRERVWIYGFLGQLPKDFNLTPQRITLNKRIEDFLDLVVDPNLYLSEEQINHLSETKGVDFNVTESLCFDVYNKKIKTDGICSTITEPHHCSLRIVEPPMNGKFRVRKLSMTEHYRLMGFVDGEFNFGDFSYSQICKRAGNGWDINLVSLLFKKFLLKNDELVLTNDQNQN